MPQLHTDPSSGTTPPAAPQLPDGWCYADDQPRDRYVAARKRPVWVPVLIAVLAVAGLLAFVVINASAHYSRGVAALDDGSYAVAAAELSSARLLVFPYRDADLLADEARRELTLQAADQEAAQERTGVVTGALDEAAAALEKQDVPGVLAALEPLRPADVRAVLRDSAHAGTTADALTSGLTAAAGKALRDLKWARAGSFAAALLALRPSSEEAAALAAKAETGLELSARLAKARDAAHKGHWHAALRLALAVTAVRKGFPGAAAVIADARTALAPKPKPTPAATAAATATTPATSTGGTSSGSSSQPPPP